MSRNSPQICWTSTRPEKGKTGVLYVSHYLITWPSINQAVSIPSFLLAFVVQLSTFFNPACRPSPCCPRYMWSQPFLGVYISTCINDWLTTAENIFTDNLSGNMSLKLRFKRMCYFVETKTRIVLKGKNTCIRFDVSIESAQIEVWF